MSRDIFLRPQGGADAFVHPAPPPGYSVQLMVVAPRILIEAWGSLRRGFMLMIIRDDAIRGSKPTSVAIAKLATMVLSEPLGLSRLRKKGSVNFARIV